MAPAFLFVEGGGTVPSGVLHSGLDNFEIHYCFVRSLLYSDECANLWTSTNLEMSILDVGLSDVRCRQVGVLCYILASNVVTGECSEEGL